MSGFYVKVERKEYEVMLMAAADKLGWKEGPAGQDFDGEDWDNYYVWFQEKNEKPAKRGTMYWNDNNEYNCYMTYYLPVDFDKVLNRLQRLQKIMIGENAVEFDYDNEVITVGCTDVPFSTVERIYQEVKNGK